tara:strand:+ start:261 stop:617 length:357 start_codon:yes stop_codon:yes gene_type:complete
MPNKFKTDFSFERREQESSKILTKYPDKIPVIVQRSEKCKNIEDINKNKFLVPGDLTLAQFVYVIKKRISVGPEQSIYIFLNEKTLASATYSLSQIYNEFRDKDGFLYLDYASENTFG